MVIFFSSCDTIGKLLFVVSAITFVAFFVSVIVIHHNEKKDWSGNKLAFYMLPLFYPRESVAEKYSSWYPVYKYSGLMFFPCVTILFVSTYYGFLCAPN